MKSKFIDWNGNEVPVPPEYIKANDDAELFAFIRGWTEREMALTVCHTQELKLVVDNTKPQ